MRIAVGSAHRSSAHNVERYLRQVSDLERILRDGDTLRIIAVEGDSVDNTRERLIRESAVFALQLELVTCNHGGPHFGSVDTPERMRALSMVGNAIFEAVRPDDDVLLYVESDLMWNAVAALALIDRMRESDFDVLVPLVMAGRAFYDTWAFRGLDGARFGPFAPYHSQLHNDLMEIASAGSCLAIRGEVARRCRIRNDNALVGWCEDVRNNGYRIAVDPTLIVRQL